MSPAFTAPALAAALGDGDPELRVASAMALENMGPAARGAAPALADALDDPEQSVRQAAVKALGAMGPAASPALPRRISIEDPGPRSEKIPLPLDLPSVAQYYVCNGSKEPRKQKGAARSLSIREEARTKANPP